MRSHDATDPPSAIELDALVRLVGELVAAYETLAQEFHLLGDVTRSIIEIQNNLIAIVDASEVDDAQPLDDAVVFDDGLGQRREARQSRAHSAAMRHRSRALVDQARALHADAADVLASTNGDGPGAPGDRSLESPST